MIIKSRNVKRSDVDKFVVFTIAKTVNPYIEFNTVNRVLIDNQVSREKLSDVNLVERIKEALEFIVNLNGIRVDALYLKEIYFLFTDNAMMQDIDCLRPLLDQNNSYSKGESIAFEIINSNLFGTDSQPMALLIARACGLTSEELEYLTRKDYWW